VTGTALKQFREAEELFVAAVTSSQGRDKPKAAADLAAAYKLLSSLATSSGQRKNPVLYFYLALTCSMRGDPEQVANWAKRAVTLNPKFHEAYTLLGEALYETGKPDKADVELTRALKEKPDYKHALLARALYRNWQGKTAEARVDLKTALDLNPKDKLTRLYRVVIEGPPLDEKYEKETAHYVVRSNVSQDFTDKMAAQAELILRLYESRDMFKDTLPANWPKKFAITIFRDEESWSECFGDRGKSFLGFYHPALKQLFLYKQPFEADTLGVLYHEGFHQFLAPRLPNAPTWFDEGMGDYFGASKYLRTSGGKEGMAIHTNNGRLKLAREAVRAGKFIPWKRLMTATHDELYDPRVIDLAYAESWSIVYFLCQFKDGRYADRLVTYYKQLKKGVGAEKAFEKAFGEKEEADEIQGAWRAWVQTAAEDE
jgi:hypothetical protein